MPGGGMRWNSHLPKKNAGAPPGVKKGVRRPGIKGGQRGRRTLAQKRDDPLYIPGQTGANQMYHQPEWLTVDEVIKGARAIQEILTKPRWENRFETMLEGMFDEATGTVRDEYGAPSGQKQRNMRAAELLLQYKYGKPVAINENINREFGAEELNRMASRVFEQLSAIPPDDTTDDDE